MPITEKPIVLIVFFDILNNLKLNYLLKNNTLLVPVFLYIKIRLFICQSQYSPSFPYPISSSLLYCSL